MTRDRNRACLVAYVLAAALLAVLMLIQTLNRQWSTDFWLHLATVRAMAEHPWRHVQPFTGIDTQDPLLSPYMLILGLASRWSHVSAQGVLAVAGLLNLGLWLFAFRRFVISLTSNPAAPFWSLLLTLLAWGIGPWRWSGYLNLNSIGFGLPYPSMFATALSLLLFACAQEWLVRGGRLNLAVAGIATPLVLLIHPFTAVWASVAGGAIVVSLAREDRVRRIGVLTGVTAAGAVLALLWPYYSLMRLAGVGSQFDATNRALYSGLLSRSFLILPGIAALVLRARRNIRDPLVLMFLGTAILFLLGALSHHWSLARVFPGMVLAAHVALGDAVALFLVDSPVAKRNRVLAAAVVGAFFCVGLIGSAQGVVRMMPRSWLPRNLAQDPRLASIIEPYRGLFESVAWGGVVVTSPSLNQVVAGVTGHVLVPPVPTFLDDTPARHRDQTEILDPSTNPARLRTVLAKDHISFMVLTREDAEILLRKLRDVASVLVSTNDYVVLRVQTQS